MFLILVSSSRYLEAEVLGRFIGHMWEKYQANSWFFSVVSFICKEDPERESGSEVEGWPLNLYLGADPENHLSMVIIIPQPLPSVSSLPPPLNAPGD